MKLIEDFIERSQKRKLYIGVLGDALVDEYYHVEMDRISPEAPIPVLSSKSTSPYKRPGGAANVCWQFYHQNVRSFLIAPLDAYAKSVYRDRVDTSFSVDLRTGKVPVKRRYFTDLQAVMRHDIEQKDFGEMDIVKVRKQIYASLRDLVREGLDVLIISDYAKGTLDKHLIQQIILYCVKNRIPVIIDPKKRPLADYKYATVIKPNSSEARVYAPVNNLQEQLDIIQEQTKCQAVIVTRSGEAPIGCTNERYFYLDEGPPVKVSSVIGGGDCFTSFLATAIGLGFSYESAAQVAHYAGKCYVQRQHNNPVMPHELRGLHDPSQAKLVSLEQLRSILEMRHPEATLVFTNGVFRIPHAGHTKTLSWARQQGDVLIVGINNDRSAAQIKPGYIMPLAERSSMIAALSAVDYVVEFDEDTPEKLLEILQPHILVKGHDSKHKKIPGHQHVGEVRIAPDSGIPTHSSEIERTILNTKC